MDSRMHKMALLELLAKLDIAFDHIVHQQHLIQYEIESEWLMELQLSDLSNFSDDYE